MSAIVIIHAGMSEESSTAKLARDIRDALVAGATEGTVSIEEVALRPLAHDIVDHVLTGFAPPRLEEALSVVGRADGIVALTPTYQASYSGLFKSFFDILDTDALRGTPVLLGATGGTPRHSLVTEVAMRPLFIYAHADPVPTAIYAATEDWGAHAADSDGTGGTSLVRRIARGADELLHRLGTDADASDAPAKVEGVTKHGHGEGSSDTFLKTNPISGSSGTVLESRAPTVSEADTWPGFTDFDTLLGGTRR